MNKLALLLISALSANAFAGFNPTVVRKVDAQWKFGSNEFIGNKAVHIQDAVFSGDRVLQVGYADLGVGSKVWTIRTQDKTHIEDFVVSAPESAAIVRPPELTISDTGLPRLKETVTEADGTKVTLRRQFDRSSSDLGPMTQERITRKEYPEGFTQTLIDENSLFLTRKANGPQKEGAFHFKNEDAKNIVRVEVNRAGTELKIHAIDEVRIYKITEKDFDELSIQLVSREWVNNAKLFTNKRRQIPVPQEIRPRHTFEFGDAAK